MEVALSEPRGMRTRSACKKAADLVSPIEEEVYGIENPANVERLISNLEKATTIPNSQTSSPAHSDPDRDPIFEDEETMEGGTALTEAKKHKAEAKKSKSKKEKKQKRSHDETSEERKERKRQKKLRKESRRESRGEH